MQLIEEAYKILAEGTRYVYDRVHTNEEIAEAWVRTKLANAANAYQTLAYNVWQAILERTDEDNQRQICQATQLTRVNDALAFLAEANTARSQHLATFQGNVELWAADHQRKMNRVEEELRLAREEIRRIATRIPLPGSPRARALSPEPLQLWHSPAKIPSTSTASAPAAPPPLPMRPALRSPIRLAPAPHTWKQRLAAIPPSSPPLPPLPPLPAVGNAGGRGGGSPPWPRQPVGSPPPSPLPPLSGDDDDLYVQNLPMGRPPPGAAEPTRTQLATMLTPEEIARLVGAGIGAARQAEPPANGPRIHTSRLKMQNPEKFDGKSSSTFNQWWESVTMYLGFYPETIDCQKIAWVGTLLTDTALVWHLHRYRELRDNDTWANYTAAIQAEYRNECKAVDAQLKLGQLKYQGSIHTYLTEFRTLNNFARATGEALREKVDLAMPDAVLDMQFAHYLEDFADDEGFLQATHQAGLQVEKKKALKQAREAGRPIGNTRAKEKKKEEKKKNSPSERPVEGGQKNSKPEDEFGKPGAWESYEAALEGVPHAEQTEHSRRKGCHRCGRTGHRSHKCYARTTINGTELPQALWTVSAGNKQRREEEPTPPAKVQKISAAEAMDAEPTVQGPIWEEEDF